MSSFDPNAAAAENSGVFGLPHTEAEASLVYLPIPWEATVSYRSGTARGPAAILAASRQVDLFDLDVERPYEAGLFWMRESEKIREWNKQACASEPQVNELSLKLNQFVHEETLRLLNSQKLVGIIGGEHSVPFGAIQAMSTLYPSFGILHFDAHSDTRRAFEGFIGSHASIFHNVLEQIPTVTKLVQVGIRDFCEEEFEYCRAQGDRVHTFFDRDLAQLKADGTPWTQISREIISQLPPEVWISFDIDGLDPRLCPHTGTPVPGGLDFYEACSLISQVVRSGRKIIGFDLCEVAPSPIETDEWDANVGARLLYQLSAWTLASQGKAQIYSAPRNR